MTRDEWREMLRREAEAWRKIGRRIERQPDAPFWMPQTNAMTARAEKHLDPEYTSVYTTGTGVARAIGAYWLALECEEEAKR